MTLYKWIWSQFIHAKVFVPTSEEEKNIQLQLASSHAAHKKKPLGRKVWCLRSSTVPSSECLHKLSTKYPPPKKKSLLFVIILLIYCIKCYFRPVLFLPFYTLDWSGSENRRNGIQHWMSVKSFQTTAIKDKW